MLYIMTLALSIANLQTEIFLPPPPIMICKPSDAPDRPICYTNWGKIQWA
jgi:hypothetical protein